MKQRAKVLIALSAFFVLSAFSLTPVSARPPPLYSLPGVNINIAPPGAVVTFYAYELTKIHHGYTSEALYGGKSWSEFSLEEKIEFLDTASFSLYIRETGEQDWQSMKLNQFFWFDRDADVMYYLGYKVFPKNTFDPGTYEFKGVWYLEEYGISETWSYENTPIVNVLP